MILCTHIRETLPTRQEYQTKEHYNTSERRHDDDDDELRRASEHCVWFPNKNAWIVGYNKLVTSRALYYTIPSHIVGVLNVDILLRRIHEYTKSYYLHTVKIGLIIIDASMSMSEFMLGESSCIHASI
ncbi:Uncharacterized protein FWK35_00000230 [Aphis craccivora]|uniref:Uncharacterized protein n=1 Tax=Aphis craccivora TaxID=307492 RepID=A0A6G0ZQF4_APHCR|nr:Uncharacterized protein FWK35_00000230 [Aphis craccivora]